MRSHSFPEVEEQEDNEDIIRDICSNNGLQYSNLSQEACDVSCIEMFFTGLPRIPNLSQFVQLQELVIVGQRSVTTIEGLENLSLLQELWIAECSLKVISSLDNLQCLKKLYLYDNLIAVIENLDMLESLQVLWLNGNKIQKIQNLSSLKNLQELNLAENQIKCIGSSLMPLIGLESIDLSGNLLSSFVDLMNMSQLPSLQHISFQSPIYAPCPIGCFYNYTIFLLSLFPSLLSLDGVEVNFPHFKDMSENNVASKRSYYQMKVHSLIRNLTTKQKEAQAVVTKLHEYIEYHQRELVYTTKRIQLNIANLDEAKEDYDDRALERKQMLGKLKAMKERVQLWNNKKKSFEKDCSGYVASEAEHVHFQLDCLALEFENCGNIRFDHGTPGDAWYCIVRDIVLTRFCPTDFRHLGVRGIEVKNIVKVYNRSLWMNFAAPTIATSDLDNEKSEGRRDSCDYLFAVIRPDVDDFSALKIAVEGFPSISTFKDLKEVGIPLCSSVGLADRFRVAAANASYRTNSSANHSFRQGQLLLVRACLSRSAEWNKVKSIDCKNYETYNSVYRQCKEITDKTGFLESSPHFSDRSTGMSCNCSTQTGEWYFFKPSLLLPEYLIQIEYTLKDHGQGLMSPDGFDIRRHQLEELASNDEMEQINFVEEGSGRILNLMPENLLSWTGRQSVQNITSLSLMDQSLCSLNGLSDLLSLKKLVVPFNKIQNLKPLSHLKIEHLDVSFNKISSLEEFEDVKHLTHLDLRHNQLTRTMASTLLLRRHAPNLSSLNWLENPWLKGSQLRLLVIGHLSILKVLDEESVEKSEKVEALELLESSKISLVMLANNSNIQLKVPKRLSLASTAHMLTETTHPFDYQIDYDVNFVKKITVLNLNGLHITKLVNLDQLEFLRWASFEDNYISRIEGLDKCTFLEELSLRNNLIQKVEGLWKLTCLRHLNVSQNFVTALEGSSIQTLSWLTYLNLHDNCLHSLIGLEHLTALTELYVSHNMIHSSRDIFFLKHLHCLKVVDMAHNPICSSLPKYRLFVTYHIKELKTLDGEIIDAQERVESNAEFGGRLTSELISEKLYHSSLPELVELNLPSCALQTVDPSLAKSFLCLQSVSLQDNHLSSLSGLIYLENLNVLCLNRNKIETLIPQDVYVSQASSYLPKLEVLHLAFNSIKDINSLQLPMFPSLKALFLQGNELTKIEDVGRLPNLQELVLDQNKIRMIGSAALVGLTGLVELHAEDNRLKETTCFLSLSKLKGLHISVNRIQDLCEIEKLTHLRNLLDISLSNNQVTRKQNYRLMLVNRMPNLRFIDGTAISDDERYHVELQSFEHQPRLNIVSSSESLMITVSNAKQGIPMKVTKMNLAGAFLEKPLLQFDDLTPDILRGIKKTNCSPTASILKSLNSDGGRK